VAGATNTGTMPRAVPESTRMFGTRDDKALQAAVNLLAPGGKPGSALAGLLHKWTTMAKGDTAGAGGRETYRHQSSEAGS
jgi:carboxyl-terminal processing protease